MIADTAETPANEQRPTTSPPKAVRLTRRQLAKQEEDLKQLQSAQTPPQHDEPEAATEHVAQTSIEEVQDGVGTSLILKDATSGAEEATEAQLEMAVEPEVEAQEETIDQTPEIVPQVEVAEHTVKDMDPIAQEPQLAEPRKEAYSEVEDIQQPVIVQEEPEAHHHARSLHVEPEAVTPSVEVTTEPEPKTLAAERPSEASRSPVMNHTPSRRASRSPSKSPMRIEESIEALDALEEALENVGKAVSHFDSSNDDKSPRKQAFPRDVATPNAKAKTPKKTPMFTRVSKTPSAAPKSMKPASSLARASSVRVAPSKEVRKGSTETVDYLALKRRPVSVSFPTPPPPPKGRAPTKATFQLSSDATAAKLRVEKEERLKRQAEREAEGAPVKQRPISMPPIAKSMKPLTKATFQLPGEAIAAKLKAQKEERLKIAESAQTEKPKARPVSISMPPPAVKSTKPLTKATFQLPGEAIAAKLRAQREERQKREEEAEATRKAAAASKSRPTIARKSVALPTRSQPSISIPPPPPKFDTQHPLTTVRSTSLASKRSSTQLSASRSTSVSSAKSTITPVDAAQQKIKARDLFNRDKADNQAREKERKEKEEAAKRARAQAAERGRIASREWAEKQRRKMVDAVRSKAEAA